MTSTPIACTLTPEQLRCESADLLPGLCSIADSRTWTPSGIQVVFAPRTETLQTIARVVDRERACCAFLTFQLSVPAGGAPFVLDISGPAGTLEFLSGLGLTAEPSGSRS
jgi:hypothetical protein